MGALEAARTEAESEARRAGDAAKRAVQDEVQTLRRDRDVLAADAGALKGWLEGQRERLRATADDLRRMVDDPEALGAVEVPEVTETEPAGSSSEPDAAGSTDDVEADTATSNEPPAEVPDDVPEDAGTRANWLHRRRRRRPRADPGRPDRRGRRRVRPGRRTAALTSPRWPASVEVCRFPGGYDQRLDARQGLMLVLLIVSCGLLLVACLLLILGLFQGDGNALLYASIACTVLSGAVLWVVIRLADRRAERTASSTADESAADGSTEEVREEREREVAAVTSTAHTGATPASVAPIPPTPPSVTLPLADLDADDDRGETRGGAVPVDRAAGAVPIDRAEPNGAPRDPDLPGPPTAVGDRAPDAEPPPEPATTDTSGKGPDDDAPIGDYANRSVAEILDALPRLYDDELQAVRDREASGEHRAVIIDRIAELRDGGADTGIDVGSDAGEAASTSLDAMQRRQTPPGDDFDFVFPIAGYDRLPVDQIVPLLDELFPDELSDVRTREQRGAARRDLLAEIDRRLIAEGIDPPPAGPDDAQAPEPDQLPIVDYDRLTVADIRPQLASLSKDELSRVRAHEAQHSGRRTLLSDMDRRLTSRTEASSSPASGAFPIPNYDSLTVAAIRPKLRSLSQDDLELVLARERAGAARKTILDTITRRLK